MGSVFDQCDVYDLWGRFSCCERGVAFWIRFEPWDELAAPRTPRLLQVRGLNWKLLSCLGSQDWSEEDEGWLRIWLRSDEVDMTKFPRKEGTQVVLRKKLQENRPDLEDTDSSYFVEVSPKAG